LFLFTRFTVETKKEWLKKKRKKKSSRNLIVIHTMANECSDIAHTQRCFPEESKHQTTDLGNLLYKFSKSGLLSKLILSGSKITSQKGSKHAQVNLFPFLTIFKLDDQTTLNGQRGNITFPKSTL